MKIFVNTLLIRVHTAEGASRGVNEEGGVIIWGAGGKNRIFFKEI